jgi:2,3,4,5-tetrahydropyridine-2-carboxylate N-succinyltransferase
MHALQQQIELLFDNPPEEYTSAHHAVFAAFKDALNRGAIRAAEPDSSAPSGWRVNAWVKKGILLGFRMGALVV